MESCNSKKDDHDYDFESLQKEKNRGQYLKWNGFWFSQHCLQPTHELLNHFKPLPTDIIMASFPKTGTTWLKALLYSIINRSSSSRNTLFSAHHPQSLVPTLEIDLYGTDPKSLDAYPSTNSASTSSRIFASHLPYRILSKVTNSSDCRVVYITRNPKDTLISMWEFVNKSKVLEAWPLEVAQDNFCDGFVFRGPYYDHVLEYWKESLEKPKKVLFITYEGLKDDCKNQVKKLAEFLGCPFGDAADDEEMVEEIVSNCSFEKLKSYEGNKSSEDTLGKMKFPLNSFFRKGEVGDHKNYLTAEIIERIDTITKEKFHGSGLIYGI